MKFANLTRTLFALVTLTLFTACGPKTSATPEPKNVDEPAAKAEPATSPKVEPETVTETSPSGPRAIFLRYGLSMPKPCRRHLTNGVPDEAFLDCLYESAGEYWESEGAVPLVCYDPANESWIDFSAENPPAECFPGSTRLSTVGGHELTLGDDIVPAICEPDGSLMAATTATWPVQADDDIGYFQTERGTVSPPTDGTAITDSQLAQVKKYLAGVIGPGGMPPLKVLQVVHLEMDGDGVPDALISVSAPDADDITYKPGGLFMVLGSAPDEVTPLHTSSLEEFRVLGVSDFDDNNRQEFVIESNYYEGTYWFVEHLVGGEPVMLGGAGCGA